MSLRCIIIRCVIWSSMQQTISIKIKLQMNTVRKFQTVPHTINFDNPWIIRLFMTQMIWTVKNQQPTIADYRSLQIENRRYDTFTLLRRLKWYRYSTIVSWNKESFKKLKVISSSNWNFLVKIKRYNYPNSTETTIESQE